MIMSVMHFDDLLVPDESVDEAAASPLEGDGGGGTGTCVRLRLQPPLR